MKLNITTDFTKFPRAVSVLPAGEAGAAAPYDRAVLPHDERHLRRRVIETASGGKVLVDLPEPAVLNDGDRLVLEDGRQIGIVAAPEEVYEVRARDAVHLAELAWHIGNRRLEIDIAQDRILILRDPAAKAMLEGLGVAVSEVSHPFSPVPGAHSGHDHDHHHHHAHDHHHHDHD